MNAGPLEPVLTLSPTPWDGANMSGPGKGRTSPAWAGDLWSVSPMDHQQLAMRMVCLWGLVKAYQQTRQSTYVCPPAPHVIEAFNHKVNHDSHKELGTQEREVLQYACALQYVSYSNNERYKDHLAPVVKAFWDEVAHPLVVELSTTWTSHTLWAKQCTRTVWPKFQIMGVQNNVVLICAPFFKGIESHHQYETRWHQQEECRHIDALGDHHSPSRGPKRRPQGRENKPDAPKPSRAL